MRAAHDGKSGAATTITKASGGHLSKTQVPANDNFKYEGPLVEFDIGLFL